MNLKATAFTILAAYSLLSFPLDSQAQYNHLPYAPQGQVKCEYWKVKIKDQQACMDQAKFYNSMNQEQKREYNQRVNEHNAAQDRKQMLNELRDINRKVSNRRGW